MTGFDVRSSTRLVSGEGSLARLGELARELGGTRALLVSDAGLRTAGHVSHADTVLREAGLAVTVYDGVHENPTSLDVDACAAVARAASVDLIVGLGGGSSMDTAKGCNFILTNGGKMRDYWGTGRATRPMLPLIAVPTTAGTGSECQSFALIADPETHAKMACGDPKAAARVALLDPLLTLSQPRAVTAHTGMDALTHAVETAVCRRRNPYSLLFSREAFRLLAGSFARVLSRPDDVEARTAMQLGAAYAGIAIENSMLGAAHSAANPLTARHGIIHGEAVGLMLPEVVRYNAHDESAARAYRELALDAGLAPPDAPDRTAAESLAAWLERQYCMADMPSSAVRLIDLSGIPELARHAAEQWTAAFNPRPIDAEGFRALYAAALSGLAES